MLNLPAITLIVCVHTPDTVLWCGHYIDLVYTHQILYCDAAITLIVCVHTPDTVLWRGHYTDCVCTLTRYCTVTWHSNVMDLLAMLNLPAITLIVCLHTPDPVLWRGHYTDCVCTHTRYCTVMQPLHWFCVYRYCTVMRAFIFCVCTPDNLLCRYQMLLVSCSLLNTVHFFVYGITSLGDAF